MAEEQVAQLERQVEELRAQLEEREVVEERQERQLNEEQQDIAIELLTSKFLACVSPIMNSNNYRCL